MATNGTNNEQDVGINESMSIMHGQNGRGQKVSSQVQMTTGVGKRRTFSRTHKERVVAEAARCPHGELGALLRREGIYSSTLSSWRKEVATDSSKSNRAISRKEKKQIEQLEKENVRLRRELEKKDAIISAQKKLADLIDIMNRSD